MKATPRLSWPSFALLFALPLACRPGATNEARPTTTRAAGADSPAAAASPIRPSPPTPASTPVPDAADTVTVVGTARNAKLGAVLDAKGGLLWIDGLDSWPDALQGKRVRVTGRIVVRRDLPVFVRVPGEPEKTGMPVPEGADVNEAGARRVITGARWEIAE